MCGGEPGYCLKSTVWIPGCCTYTDLHKLEMFSPPVPLSGDVCVIPQACCLGELSCLVGKDCSHLYIVYVLLTLYAVEDGVCLAHVLMVLVNMFLFFVHA